LVVVGGGASKGNALKSYSQDNSCMNEVTINVGILSSGQYKYALIVDRK